MEDMIIEIFKGVTYSNVPLLLNGRANMPAFSASLYLFAVFSATVESVLLWNVFFLLFSKVHVYSLCRFVQYSLFMLVGEHGMFLSIFTDICHQIGS